MKFNRRHSALALLVGCLLASKIHCGAFALLGPVQPWMQSTNNVIGSGDIGGPMLLTNEYRWNVPVVTYGFDKSFTDYFGSNGVAAVESAIQILNNLPPASQIVPTNYPFWSQNFNPSAQSLFVQDLKSTTLSLLLEQMGLAQPTRNTFVLRQWNPIFIVPPNSVSWQLNWPEWVYPDYVSPRNFDPQSLASSFGVNGILYIAYIRSYADQNYVMAFPADINSSRIQPAVADRDLHLGGYFTGLTYDDVGGLRYLLSSNNINFETTLAGVIGYGTNANSLVNGAWRPGIEKITFLPHPMASPSGNFLPLTNYFTDRFISNGIALQQSVARIVSQPDFLFSANNSNALFQRTDTTTWLNNSAANGQTNGAGPGVICPPVRIEFQKTTPGFVSGDYFGVPDETVEPSWHFWSLFPGPRMWASFDDSTNFVTYPSVSSVTNQTTVRLRLIITSNPRSYPPAVDRMIEWKLAGISGAPFIMQTSTNLSSWVSLFDITNNGGLVFYQVNYPTSRSRYYRVVPQ